MEVRQIDDSVLVNGDCLEVMEQLIQGDVKVDAVICDPPYGTTACKWDSVIPFELMWKCIKGIRKDNSPILLFGNEPFSTKLRYSNLKEYKYDIYWKKEKPTNVFTISKQFGRVIENISVFYKKQPIYNPVMELRENVTNPKPQKGNLNIVETDVITGVRKHSNFYNPYTKYPINLLQFNRDSKKGNKSLHPTQKPVALMEYLVKTYTNEGDLVLDFTMGSGTTGAACKNLNRKFIGIELDKGYFDIACKRIEEGK